MRHPTDIHVGARIRIARKARGMTLKELADAIGISFQQLQKHETGAARIGSGRMWDICLVLRKPVSYFFEGLYGEADDGASTAISENAAEVAKLYDEIDDPTLKANITQFIRSMAGKG